MPNSINSDRFCNVSLNSSRADEDHTARGIATGGGGGGCGPLHKFSVPYLPTLDRDNWEDNFKKQGQS